MEINSEYSRTIRMF